MPRYARRRTYRRRRTSYRRKRTTRYAKRRSYRRSSYRRRRYTGRRRRYRKKGRFSKKRRTFRKRSSGSLREFISPAFRKVRLGSAKWIRHFVDAQGGFVMGNDRMRDFACSVIQGGLKKGLDAVASLISMYPFQKYHTLAPEVQISCRRVLGVCQGITSALSMLRFVPGAMQAIRGYQRAQRRARGFVMREAVNRLIAAETVNVGDLGAAYRNATEMMNNIVQARPDQEFFGVGRERIYGPVAAQVNHLGQLGAAQQGNEAAHEAAFANLMHAPAMQAPGGNIFGMGPAEMAQGNSLLWLLA